jgi:hypothetical protein
LGVLSLFATGTSSASDLAQAFGLRQAFGLGQAAGPGTATPIPQPTDRNIHRGVFSEPLGEAESASIVIDIPLAEASISALPANSEDLIRADLIYAGEIEFFAAGEQEKFVSLTNPVHTLNLGGITADLPWTIGLHPGLPLALEINNGVGRNNVFDLTGLQLDEVTIHTGVGDVDITLPAGREATLASIDGGAGNLRVTVPNEADLELDILPAWAKWTLIWPRRGRQLTAGWGIGKVTIPEALEQVELTTAFLSGSGVWQTEDYAGAERRATITYTGGVGNLTVIVE